MPRWPSMKKSVVPAKKSGPKKMKRDVPVKAKAKRAKYGSKVKAKANEPLLTAKLSVEEFKLIDAAAKYVKKTRGLRRPEWLKESLLFIARAEIQAASKHKIETAPGVPKLMTEPVPLAIHEPAAQLQVNGSATGGVNFETPAPVLSVPAPVVAQPPPLPPRSLVLSRFEPAPTPVAPQAPQEAYQLPNGSGPQAS